MWTDNPQNIIKKPYTKHFRAPKEQKSYNFTPKKKKKPSSASGKSKNGNRSDLQHLRPIRELEHLHIKRGAVKVQLSQTKSVTVSQLGVFIRRFLRKFVLKWNNEFSWLSADPFPLSSPYRTGNPAVICIWGEAVVLQAAELGFHTSPPCPCRRTTQEREAAGHGCSWAARPPPERCLLLRGPETVPPAALPLSRRGSFTHLPGGLIGEPPPRPPGVTRRRTCYQRKVRATGTLEQVKSA